MDPASSESARRFIAETPDVLTEGYTTTEQHPRGANYHWICKTCFDDFAGEFGWRVVQDSSRSSQCPRPPSCAMRGLAFDW